MAALDRELRNQGCPFSLRDTTFREARQVLNGKAKLIRQSGKGKLPHAANSISPQEEDELWSKGHLGKSSPRTLLYTLWWTLNQQLGGRGQEGHYYLEVDEFHFKTDDNGREYMEYKEGASKTRKGA